MSRRFFPAAIVLPPLFGWLKHLGEHAGLLSNELGISFVALANTAAFLIFLWLSSRKVFKEEQRSRIKKALEVSEQRLKLATQSGNMGVWDWDIATNNMVWDEAMFRLRGIEAHNAPVPYEAWEEGIHPDDRRAASDSLHSAMRGGQEYKPIFRVVWPDGTTHILSDAGVVVRDKEDAPLHMIGITWDITELKKALEEVKTLRGLLPICAWCKNIRTEKGEWVHIEQYIESHSDAAFTHGICENCAAKIRAREGMPNAK